MVPGVTDEPGRSGEDRWRIQGARGQIVPELVSVIGKVSDLEHEADEEEGKEDDTSTNEANVEVQFEIGLFVLGPGEGDVGEEPRDTLVHHVGLEAEGQEAVPEAPEAVAVDWAFLGRWGTSH